MEICDSDGHLSELSAQAFLMNGNELLFKDAHALGSSSVMNDELHGEKPG